MTKNLAAGRTSLPVCYFEERSMLEKITDNFSFLVDIFLPKSTIDKRFESVIAGILSGLHLQVEIFKPWDPRLGETYVCKWPNGTTGFAEQTSHHPPLSNFQIISPNNEWTIYGELNFDFDIGLMESLLNQKGKFTISFADGSLYQWQFPLIIIQNLFGEKKTFRFSGSFEIEDVKNNLICDVIFGKK